MFLSELYFIALEDEAVSGYCQCLIKINCHTLFNFNSVKRFSIQFEVRTGI